MEELSSQSGERPVGEQEQWRRYVADRDPAARGQLIGHYLYLAKKIAAFFYGRRRDNSIEFDDYLQHARIGLVEAVDRFDPEMNVSFDTFASYRIRGAILNAIGHYSEKSSQQTYRQSVLKERAESLQEMSGDLEPKELFEELAEVTIGLALGYILEDSNLTGADRIDRASDPYRSLELKRLQERMALIVEALPDRERQLVRYHYFEHMEFSMIAEIFGISKGRISQLHSRALRLIREAFQALEQFQANI